MDVRTMEQIEETDSRTEKEGLVKKLDGTSQRFIAYALDTYRTYGLTLSFDTVMGTLGDVDDAEERLYGSGGRVARKAKAQRPQAWWDELALLLDKLAARELTGTAARTAAMQHFAKAPDATHAKWGLRILHKDLACGVSVKTVQKVIPGLVQPFEVALAFPYDPAKHSLSGPGYVEPKLDGLRMTVVDGVPYTRNGNVVQGVSNILEALRELFARDRVVPWNDLRSWVLDGECIGTGTFEETISKARRAGQEARGLVYHVFDIIKRDEWFSRHTRPLQARRRNLEGYVKDGECIRRVPAVTMTDASFGDMVAFRDMMLEQGYEGAMWKSARAAYPFKRSPAILKFKRFETEEATIIGFKEGQDSFKGSLGSFRIRCESGEETDCGTGFTLAQRNEFWKIKSRLGGRVVEVKFQNLTGKGKLRFPVFIRFRPDKEPRR